MNKNARPWSLDTLSARLCRFAMQRTIITILLALVAVAGQGQNQDLEYLFQKYRNNPAIEYVNLLDSFPDAQRVKVAETFEFGDSLSLIRHFVEEYEQIKNFKKMKASKVIKIKGNLLMKMAMNQAFTVRIWEDENGSMDAGMPSSTLVVSTRKMKSQNISESINKTNNEKDHHHHPACPRCNDRAGASEIRL